MTTPQFHTRYAEAKYKYQDEDELWDYLREHRREDITLALGYHVMRVARETGLKQVEILERINNDGGEPYSTAFITMLLMRRPSATAVAYSRIARAVGANPLEFFELMGWVTPAEIAAYQVPGALELSEVQRAVESIPEALRPDFLITVRALARTFRNVAT